MTAEENSIEDRLNVLINAKLTRQREMASLLECSTRLWQICVTAQAASPELLAAHTHIVERLQKIEDELATTDGAIELCTGLLAVPFNRLEMAVKKQKI